MALVIRPTWDPTGTVSVRVDTDRREVVATSDGELSVYRLGEDRSAKLGWIEHPARGRPQPVSVRTVMCACLNELEAEQAVAEITRGAIGRARKRSGAFRAAAGRLEGQLISARNATRISTLPFQVLFRHASGDQRDKALTGSLAAERIGYRTPGGKADTSRLMRRLGLMEQQDRRGNSSRCQRAVSYRTGVRLCEALDIDPVEIGL